MLMPFVGHKNTFCSCNIYRKKEHFKAMVTVELLCLWTILYRISICLLNLCYIFLVLVLTRGYEHRKPKLGDVYLINSDNKRTHHHLRLRDEYIWRTTWAEVKSTPNLEKETAADFSVSGLDAWRRWSLMLRQHEHHLTLGKCLNWIIWCPVSIWEMHDQQEINMHPNSNRQYADPVSSIFIQQC